MALVVVFGPEAVGKNTVGLELQRLTGLRLFRNDMAVDMILNFFEFGDPTFHRLVSEFRLRVFEEVAASTLPGMIFTHVWALDDPRDNEFVHRVSRIFRSCGHEVCYVELTAAQEERVRRSISEMRLFAPPPEMLLAPDEQYRLNTSGDFFSPGEHLRIDSTALEPGAIAARIMEHFRLPRCA